MIFSTGSKVYETSQTGDSVRILLDNTGVSIDSLDYDAARGLFYLSDAKNNKIYKAAYSAVGPLALTPLVTSQLAGPFSVAVDWISNKLYVAQRSLSRIDVFSADGANRTSLVTADIFAPTALALDPGASLLFFADAGSQSSSSGSRLKTAKIERLLMDGTGRRTLVSAKLLEPATLAVDPLKQRLYWIDTKYDHLESCDYFGTRRHVIASGSNNLPHALSLDIFESTLYFADLTKMAVMRTPRHLSAAQSEDIKYHYKLSAGNSPRHVRVYHASKQSSRRVDPCAASGCEHFCLLSHSDASPGANTYRCRCNIGYQLRSSDRKTCERITDVLLVAQGSMIRAISADTSGDEMEARLPVLLPRLSSARALEVDARNNRTFFFDSLRRAVYQVSTTQTTQTTTTVTPLIADNLFYVESMAYDWIARNLYLAHAGRITVVQSDNVRMRRDLIRQAQVTGLALDPNAGFLFYSAVNRPARIYRSFLDGSNVTTIVASGLAQPASLACDYQTKRLYWADAHFNKLQYADYSGNGLVTLATTSPVSPSSVTLYKYHLFYMDYRLANIYKSSKSYGLAPTLLRSNLNSVQQIRIMSRATQPVMDNHPCTRQNGDCSHMCYAVPSLERAYPLARHCGCPYGLRLDAQTMTTCVANADEPTSNLCSSPQLFKCNNDRCVR